MHEQITHSFHKNTNQYWKHEMIKFPQHKKIVFQLKWERKKKNHRSNKYSDFSWLHTGIRHKLNQGISTRDWRACARTRAIFSSSCHNPAHILGTERRQHAGNPSLPGSSFPRCPWSCGQASLCQRNTASNTFMGKQSFHTVTNDPGVNNM